MEKKIITLQGAALISQLRSKAASNSCHPIKLNTLQVLRGSTCMKLAKKIHLLQEAEPGSGLLQFSCGLLTLWSAAKLLHMRVWL